MPEKVGSPTGQAAGTVSAEAPPQTPGIAWSDRRVAVRLRPGRRRPGPPPPAAWGKPACHPRQRPRQAPGRLYPLHTLLLGSDFLI